MIARQADDERQEGPLVFPRLLKGLKVAAKARLSEAERSFQEFLALAEEELGTKTNIFISSQILLNQCQEREALDWLESATPLAKFLRPFGLTPTRDQCGEFRGYWLTQDWLTEAMAEYGWKEETPRRKPPSYHSQC